MNNNFYTSDPDNLSELVDQELIHVLVGEYELMIWDTKNLPGIFNQKGWEIPAPNEPALFSFSWEEGIIEWHDIISCRSRNTIGKTPKHLTPNSCGI